MSNEHNTAFIEAAEETFEQARAEGDTETMEAVVRRLASEGFEDEAEALLEFANIAHYESI